ncbi:MAG: molecular chaperone [Candidatus Bathyarchaeia archaeon]
MVEPEEVDFESYAKIASERASVYSVLARLLLRPLSENEIFELSVQLPSTKAILEQLEAEETFLVKMKSGLEKAQLVLEGNLSRLQEMSNRLSSSYTKLFRGLSKKHSPLPPYESVYVEKEILWGNCTVDVLHLYNVAGFHVSPDLGNEPPDHIALELAFMGSLCRQESDALRRHEKNETLKISIMELDFLKDHLLSWMPVMRQSIARFDELGFYSGILELIEGWIAHDEKSVQQSVALTA